MKIIAVYMIVDEISGKFYIGSTSDLKRRMQEHKYELKVSSHHNKTLQELYNNKAKLKFHYIIKETLKEVRELEDLLLKRSSKNPNLINYSINSSGGNGIERHPNKENIITKIQYGRKKHWELLPQEEKEIRLKKFKETANSPEALEKRRKSFQLYINNTPPEKRKQSKETIEKRRQSLIGRIFNQETRNKISKSNTGKKASVESKLKMSNSRKKYIEINGPPIVTDLTKEKIRLANLGKQHSEETKKKISEQKKIWQANRSPEQRKHTEETKQLLSQKHKGKVITEEQKIKMSEAKKNRLAAMSEEEVQAFKDKLANARRESNARKKLNMIAPDL